MAETRRGRINVRNSIFLNNDVGMRVPAGVDLHMENSILSNNRENFRIEKGGSVTATNSLIQKNLARSSKSPSHESTGWTGKAQFDPKGPAAGDGHKSFEDAKLVLREGVDLHLAEFDLIAGRFFANKPYVAFSEVDEENQCRVHKLKPTADAPKRLRYIAYAAINDLRNALDQALNAASEAITDKPVKNANFPFAETPSELGKHLVTKWQYQQIPDALKPYLLTLEPYPTSKAYKGGNDMLRILGKIANANKHQVPLKIGVKNLQGVYALHNKRALKVIEFFDPYWVASKNQFIIAKTALDGEFEYDLQMPLYIYFADVETLANHPVPAALREMTAIVDGIVLGLEAETVRILRERK